LLFQSIFITITDFTAHKLKGFKSDFLRRLEFFKQPFG
jgi:hypothetical protein